MDINLARNNCEILSAEKYLNLSKEERANIIQTEIIPPTLGSDNFGKILVYYCTPIYYKKEMF